MDTLQKAIQLSEEVSFPDGYNVILVEGTGDEPYLEYIPKITLAITPSTLSSDNETFFTCTATIDDPNDPDAGTLRLEVEDGNAGSETGTDPNVDLYTYSTSLFCYYITNPSTSDRPPVVGSAEWTAWAKTQDYGLWVWTGGDSEDTYTYGECLDITKLDEDGRTVYFSPTYSAEGFVPSKVICHYKGGNTVSWSLGGIDTNDDGEVDEDEEDDLSGEFWSYPDLDVGYNRNESVINQNESSIYFMPTPGGYGKVTIHATYGDAESWKEVQVTIGYLDNASLDHSALPSSVGVGGQSELTATLTSTSGLALDGYTIYWKILGGVGQLSDSAVATAAADAEEEELDTSVEFYDEQGVQKKRWTFTLSYPVSAITSIVQNPDIGGLDPWTWDGIQDNLDIDGTSVKFAKGEVLPSDTYPIVVNYKWGGVAQTTFTGTETCDSVLISATVQGTTLNKNVILSVGGDVASNLTLTAEPTSLDRSDDSDPEAVKESTLTAVYIDSEGGGATGNIRLKFSRGGGTMPTSISLSPTDITDEAQTASSRYEVSTSYPINSVLSVKYDGTDHYSGGSFTGTSIVLGTPLDAPGLQVLICYTSGGTGTATYQSRDRDEEVDIYGIAPDGSRASVSLIVGDPDATYPAEVTFNEVTPDPVDAGHVAQIKFTMKGPDDLILPSGSNYATIWLNNSLGYLLAGKYDDTNWPTLFGGGKAGSSSVSAPVALEDDTEEEPGTGWVSYRAPDDKECEVTICGKHKDQNDADIYASENEASTVFNVKFYVLEYEEVEGSGGSITVKFDPKTKGYSTDPGWVSIWDSGAGGEADDYGSYDGDPSLWPMKLLCTPTINPPANHSLVGKKITSDGNARLASNDVPNSYGFRIEIPWTYEQNQKRYIVEVTAKNDPDTPVPYADVTILGTTVKTDVDGKAEFQALPVGTHPIYIKSSNYKWNREPEVAGTGDDYDIDTTNDTITVEQYGEGAYLLDPIDIAIDLTLVYQKATSTAPTEEEDPQ